MSCSAAAKATKTVLAFQLWTVRTVRKHVVHRTQRPKATVTSCAAHAWCRDQNELLRFFKCCAAVPNLVSVWSIRVSTLAVARIGLEGATVTSRSSV
eukprot:2878699-Pleurochrysis_carterae.AAC.2